MCPKATLLPRRRSKWFWAQFWISITFLKICLTAMLDPKNKRLKSQFSTEENSLVISVIIFLDLTTKNGLKFKNLENHKKLHFLFMGASFLNALKTWIFGVRVCFFFASNVFLPTFSKYAFGFFTAFKFSNDSVCLTNRGTIFGGLRYKEVPFDLWCTTLPILSLSVDTS